MVESEAIVDTQIRVPRRARIVLVIATRLGRHKIFAIEQILDVEGHVLVLTAVSTRQLCGSVRTQ